ncbi:gamma-aminobutyric acid receptor subunit alpha-6-like isoform X2 [Centruroides vittatus]|uniref:gamma-aminobutyric acid receptor subunit alpha-6-like isoform X2 n=1 Tax=Centruroides vittatus TaxID=120091 RepID=UPI00350EA5C3
MVLSVCCRTFQRIIRSLATVLQLNCLIIILSVYECRNDNSVKDDLIFNTSRLLNELLRAEKYDKEIRPGFGASPTVIITDIEIRSFGPVSETQMIYSMDCYFRQTWWDPRLKFQTLDLDILSLDWKFLQKVWTPDTYFLNGRYSYLHKVTVPNKFVRLRSDGQMKYSMRLTIQASCPMLLRKYPLDTQSCPLEIGSFAYPPSDVTYKWNNGKPVIIAKDVTLSQYEFLNITFEEITKLTGGGIRSSLVTRFILRRRRGYFILQIYAPCAMIVGASWVSFWINSQDAPARVAVGVTTVLTLVAMGFGGMTSIQRATSGSALDWFVILCFTFVFAAMAEYACVNLLDRYEIEKTKSKKRIQQNSVLVTWKTFTIILQLHRRI